MRRRKSKYLVRNSMIYEVGCQEKKPGSEEIQEAAGKNEPGRKKRATENLPSPLFKPQIGPFRIR
jgi:hypothetical protein